MNGAFTPKLIKNLKSAMKAKHAGSALRKLEKDTAVVGNNRVDNVLMKNGDKEKPEGVFQEAFKAPVITKEYPTITAPDSSRIKAAYKYLLQPDLKRQQILDDSGSSASVDEADSFRVNQLRKLRDTYGMDAIKGVRDFFGFGPK